jgi:hypothetical protein
MAKTKNKVLPEHAEKFREYIHKWQKLLGLQDWRLYVNYPTKETAMASTASQTEARMANIDLGMSFGGDVVNEYNLESLACHELLHVLLCPLYTAYASRNMSDTEKEGEEHRVVNVLEKVLMEKWHRESPDVRYRNDEKTEPSAISTTS